MRNLILACAVLTGLKVSAQHFCATTEAQNKWFQEHPELKAAYDKHQEEAAKVDEEMAKNGYVMAGKSAAGNYTIPVVFHILHVGGTENISDAQCIDAVNILTRDFNAANADTSNVVTQFKNLIGNPKIDFALATKDPNGNCTNGIIRHFDANTDWTNFTVNYAYTWPPNRYMNVYVVRTMEDGAAGYTYLPGSGIPTAKDAIVILQNYVGSVGTGGVYTSRALTHEVGHWLNLQHTWGSTNQPGVACGNDGVTDTPVTKGYTSCNLNNTKICNPNIVENIQNYMDYAYCQRMYTIGQSARMNTAINSSTNSRNNLSTSGNLALTGVTSPGSGCVPLLDISAVPSLTVCSGKVLSLKSFTSNANPTSYAWTADNSAIISSPSSANTSIQFSMPGITTVTCTVANANGSATETLTVMVENGIADITTFHMESFEESTTTPPSTWKIVNPTTPTLKWEINTEASSEGFLSMYVPGENIPANSIEILESPSFDFLNNQGAVFSFKYAYARANSANKDLFKVQASRDCGGTWKDIWVPSNLTLAQSSGGDMSTVFVPSSIDWKIYDGLVEHPNFLEFTTEENVRLRFFFQEDVGGSGFGNRFYLDEVNFDGPTGVNELTRAINLNVSPNPSHSGFNLKFNLSNNAQLKYSVMSVTGAVVLAENAKTFDSGSHEMMINERNSLEKGIYFLCLEVNGVKMSKKLVVD